ncbi:trypsin-like serine protease [Pseudomonas sp.]|uniref:trypsin-like serine protease n=1 Tax=Pseudomonas sp. TaxID=306 RepID=UPI001AFE5287|nr:trypsin-like serine protease [Pseudomonas sp.]MBO9549174.1 trypsin-like serine protease [Pseudomonas sp.]
MPRLPRILLLALTITALPVSAGMDEAAKAFDEGNFDAALEQYLPLAQQGDVEAQAQAGYILITGKTGVVDTEQAMQWLTKAQMQGNTRSAYILGLAYLHRLKGEKNAKEVKLDAARAVELLSKASEDPDLRTLAAKELQAVYAKGSGDVPADFENAVYWWEMEKNLIATQAAANRGDAKAAEKLGLAFVDFDPAYPSMFKDSPLLKFKNEKIEKWLSEGLKNNAASSKAREVYGCLYIDNTGIPENPNKARKWVESAHNLETLLSKASSGDTDAMLYIGDIYYETCLKNKFHDEAFPWYEKAADAGNIKRTWRLVEHSEDMAAKQHWAEIAAALKSPDGTPNNQKYGGTVLFDNIDHGSDIPWGFRHAPGTRYLSLGVVQVHAKPDADSPILHDIGSLRLVYASEAEEKGWLGVIAVSRRRYPDEFSYYKIIDSDAVEDFLDNKRTYRPNRQYLYSIVGFVKKSALASLDESPALPLPAEGLIPVPSTWKDIAIQEDRQFITKLDIQPYDALVHIKIGDNTCSGAFVLSSSLVATAGHCFKSDHDAISVIIERSATTKEVIPATIIKRTKKGNDDWAIIHLEHPPKLPVTPLEFADDLELSNYSHLAIASIGYPGDLEKVSMKRVGFAAPSIKTCALELGSHEYSAEQQNIVFSHACHTWFGDSGGPLLVWNPEKNRFEVMGINDSIETGYQGSSQKLLFQSQRFKALMYEKYKDTMAPLLKENESFLTSQKYFKNERVSNPGVSTVARAFREQVESLYSDTGSLSLEMIKTARSAAGRSPEKSPYADTPSKLGFWKKDFDETYDFIRSVEQARESCITECDKAILQESSWTLSYLQKIDLKSLAKRDDTMVMPKLNAIVVGGDLFEVDERNRVINVSRKFMNLTESGKAFNDFFRYTYSADLDALQDSDFPESDAVPTSSLHAGPNYGGDTPASIPGGNVIGTKELSGKLNGPNPPVVISSIRTQTGIPTAIDLSYSAEGGDFSDAVQQRFSTDLSRLTHGNKAAELVFYCHNSSCWMSYNSALRAIQLGYHNVFWYRGGIKSWIISSAPLDWLAAPAQ